MLYDTQLSSLHIQCLLTQHTLPEAPPRAKPSPDTRGQQWLKQVKGDPHYHVAQRFRIFD